MQLNWKLFILLVWCEYVYLNVWPLIVLVIFVVSTGVGCQVCNYLSLSKTKNKCSSFRIKFVSLVRSQSIHLGPPNPEAQTIWFTTTNSIPFDLVRRDGRGVDQPCIKITGWRFNSIFWNEFWNKFCKEFWNKFWNENWNEILCFFTSNPDSIGTKNAP